MEKVKCIVQVLCIQEDFLAIDFGSFAMMIVYDGYLKKAKTLVGCDYNQYFFNFCQEIDCSLCLEEYIGIDPNVFYFAQDIAFKSQFNRTDEQTKQFLKDNFKDYYNFLKK